MNIYLRELLIALFTGLLTGIGLSQGKVWPGALAALVALSATAWILRLSLRRGRDQYYFIPPILVLGGVNLASATQGSPALALAGGPLVAILLYLLLRSMVSRRLEPRADVPLHQNAFLASAWIGTFLSLYGLYELALEHQVSVFLPIIAAAFIAYLLAQALAFFFLIAPWEFRRESLAAAIVIGEVMAAVSLWATDAFFASALSMILLYLFWGLAYHARKELLTRRLMYEYGIISFGLTCFLLVVNQWTRAL